MNVEKIRADYDSPWKTMLRKHLRACLAFYFTPLHDAIDWTVAPEYKDKEFEKITADSEIGNKRVDILVQVQLKDGREAWLLIHIEVQGQRVKLFTRQLFTYHYRIFDTFGRHPVSLAILSDDDVNWRPDRYEIDQFDFRLQVDFPVVKLLDYDEEALIASDNIFAMVTLAHLQTMAAGKDNDIRYTTKLRLARLLWKKGYGRDDIKSLFRFLDWMLRLPPKLDIQYNEEVNKMKGVKMEFMNQWEESGYLLGIEEGIEEGLEKGTAIGRQEREVTKEILKVAERRFDIEMQTGVQLMELLDEFDLESLEDVLLFVGVAKSIDDVVNYIENYNSDNDV